MSPFQQMLQRPTIAVEKCTTHNSQIKSIVSALPSQMEGIVTVGTVKPERLMPVTINASDATATAQETTGLTSVRSPIVRDAVNTSPASRSPPIWSPGPVSPAMQHLGGGGVQITTRTDLSLLYSGGDVSKNSSTLGISKLETSSFAIEVELCQILTVRSSEQLANKRQWSANSPRDSYPSHSYATGTLVSAFWRLTSSAIIV
ncbi:hypothetical protein Z517_09250 [Fonsecaea pedrosoi CBS 271.37]|uniref:Unplaced genomic scaffold supercont1.6, whole genome shotgun sequence n=1 Tax=Fonsecaea pedrosoi CBS 271.37 TaxID=1442368 RepID=A0A0D2DGJ2_9EURO|nr:uncharacterized protein Z517_09250 [Fonsecaea pedrosoi CBS 271.37]KIW76806.1 hypothetical protein Z517_09250 [Fonsecaea pedrosoi CBS 271.37]